MQILTHSAKETQDVAGSVLKNVHEASIIALYGDLGSGKTTFVQGLAKELGVVGRVNSPTFLIHKTYKTGDKKIIRLHHFDLYRLGDEQEIAAIGLEDVLSEPDSLIVIEWPEKADKLLPANRINIHFEYKNDSERLLKIDSAL